MKHQLDSKNPSSRAWLKWLAEQINNQKVTECLKNRVKNIRMEGAPESFTVTLEVTGEYARKILEIKKKEVLSALDKGYQEQGGQSVNDVLFVTA